MDTKHIEAAESGFFGMLFTTAAIVLVYGLQAAL